MIDAPVKPLVKPLAKLSSAALLLALLTTACPREAPPPPGADPIGEKLWVKAACHTCHGGDGKGFAGLGPSIQGKQSNWTREKIVEYVDDPAAYSKKVDHLGYFGKEMPAIPMSITLEERGKIADHALWLMQQP